MSFSFLAIEIMLFPVVASRFDLSLSSQYRKLTENLSTRIAVRLDLKRSELWSCCLRTACLFM